MKSLVRKIALILVSIAVLSTLSACGGNKDDGGTGGAKVADYTLTVIDGVGNPVSDVIVKYKDVNGESKTRVTGKDGTVNLKGALVGENATIEQGFSTAEILEPTVKLEEGKTSVRVVVRDSEKAVELYGEIGEGSYAHHVSVGEYNIPGNKNTMSYFVFNATIPGVYKVSFTSDDTALTVGYYGIPMFVQTTHRGEGEYDGKSFELIIQDASSPYVIGLSFVRGEDAVLKIERTGDAPFDPSFAPWIEVQAPAGLEKCDVAGKELASLNMADSSLSVTLGDDGFYYTNTGKKVYVRVTSDVEYGRIVEEKFVPIVQSLAFLAGFIDKNVGGNVGGYIYDENGDFVCKKRYNDMIETYMDYVDTTYGVVPLTEDFAECIKLLGRSNGWWDENGVGSVFDGVVVYPENAWLIYCMA